MNFLAILFVVPAVLGAFDEYWITPCGHVYKKALHPLRAVRNAQTLLRLKHQFRHAQEFISDNEELGILEDLPHSDADSYVIAPSTYEIYNNVKDIRRLISILPLTYRTLQDLAFSLKIIHEELSDKEDETHKKRHTAVTELMDKNAQLLCELDYAMNRNNVEFSRIDQLTLSQKVMEPFEDFTFTHMKHSHILKEYRTFIKYVNAQIMKLL